MKALVRDLFGFALVYVTGIVVTLGWIAFGFYIYFRPMPPDALMDSDFNHDIGNALVAQGLIFFSPFAIALLIRLVRGKHEEEERRKDRQILLKMHQWMLEQRNKTEGEVKPTFSPTIDLLPEEAQSVERYPRSYPSLETRKQNS